MRKLIRVYCSGHVVACLVGSADYKGISVYLPNLVPADLPRAGIKEASVSVGPSSRQIMPLSVSKPASSALLAFSHADGNTPCAVKTVPPPILVRHAVDKVTKEIATSVARACVFWVYHPVSVLGL
jgi:hypothetical protein